MYTRTVLMDELKTKKPGLSYDAHMMGIHMRLVAIALLKHARYNPKLKRNIQICTEFKAKGQWQYATSQNNESYRAIKNYFDQIHHTLDLPTYISYKGERVSNPYFQELLEYLMGRIARLKYGKVARYDVEQLDNWLVY